MNNLKLVCRAHQLVNEGVSVLSIAIVIRNASARVDSILESSEFFQF